MTTKTAYSNKQFYNIRPGDTFRFFLLPINTNSELNNKNFYIQYHIHKLKTETKKNESFYNYKICTKENNTDICKCRNIDLYEQSTIARYILNIAYIDKNNNCFIKFISINNWIFYDIINKVNKINWPVPFNLTVYPLIEIFRRNKTEYTVKVTYTKPKKSNQYRLSSNIIELDNSNQLVELIRKQINPIDFNKQKRGKVKKISNAYGIKSITSLKTKTMSITNKNYFLYHRIQLVENYRKIVLPLFDEITKKINNTKYPFEISSFPLYYWAIDNTQMLRAAYQLAGSHNTGQYSDFIKHYDKDVLFVKKRYTENIPTWKVSSNIVVKTFELCHDTVVTKLFYKKLKQASKYFHSTQHYIHTIFKDKNKNIRYYWENNDYHIKIYNRSLHNYKNQASPDYVILRFEIRFKNCNELYKQLIAWNNRKRKHKLLLNQPHLHLAMLFESEIYDFFVTQFRKQLLYIFPKINTNIPLNRNNIYYKADKVKLNHYESKLAKIREYFDTFIEKIKNKYAKKHIAFKYKSVLDKTKAIMNAEICSYMRARINPEIIEFISKNALKFPIIISQSMYVIEEWKRCTNNQKHISDTMIANIVKCNRGNYAHHITNILFDKMTSKFKNATIKQRRQMRAASFNNLHQILCGKSFDAVRKGK